MKVFLHPFTMMVSGSSGSGKSTFVFKLLENSNQMISPNISKIIWHYSHWQEGYDKLQRDMNVTFKQGPPSEEDIQSYSNSILILDDLMTELASLSSHIFTKYATI